MSAAKPFLPRKDAESFPSSCLFFPSRKTVFGEGGFPLRELFVTVQWSAYSGGFQLPLPKGWCLPETRRCRDRGADCPNWVLSQTSGPQTLRGSRFSLGEGS